MTTRYFRLDRLLSEQLQISRSRLRPLLAAGRVRVNGEIEKDRQRIVGPFEQVQVDERIVHGKTPLYLMLNKPAGVVSATRDEQHTTVVDLVPEALRDAHLHLAGRLDYNSTGLVILTNDGSWSRRLSEPDTGVWKHYRVTLELPLDEHDVEAFAAGMRFEFEGLVTRPARLLIRAQQEADVWLQEGRYHQIRRMFAQRGNKVKTLHRLAVGNLQLDKTLAPGECRALTEHEVQTIAD
ncbi:rRNA pseudouridine synthase [Alcanivorax sp. S6407]|uniref:pseudouridine synthase n=1 Tax=Alcanivorax sp. S6407 TaxID=2926424 RepID=UPI001FF28430|nr:pseudouridine synthase [Alcanivorax sp. S6407]MCK0155380.1 rRNA pseudouridine synthase [Alcanivorax sp. S6407]